jgi:collagenase-like PrtC family protease
VRLVVATNWDDDLLRGLAGLPVYAVFGKLQRDLVGGGRPASVLPAVDWEGLVRHVQLAHELGMRFLYLWNALSLADAEYRAPFVARMREQLRDLVAAGIDGVVVGLPWMIEVVKETEPALEVSVSSMVRVITPREAQQFQSMGADTIILHHSANRDFHVLDEIRAAVTCDLELILNNSCVYQCPYGACHQVSPSFHSRPDSPDLLEYELFWCAGRFALDAAEIIRSRWIRPEDLHVYERHGFDRFKLAGRGRDTAWLLRAARAYAARRYAGDLTDIISMSQHAPLRLARRRAAEGGAHAAAWAALAEQLGPVRELSVDNTAIPADFLSFFETHDCNRLSCHRCRYCEQVARRAVKGVPGWDAAAAPRMPQPEMFEELVLSGPTSDRPAAVTEVRKAPGGPGR